MLTDLERVELTYLYGMYASTVLKIVKKYKKMLPLEDIEDVSQSVWEQICVKWHLFDVQRGELGVWLDIVTRSTISNLRREAATEKRLVNLNTISYDSLVSLIE